MRYKADPVNRMYDRMAEEMLERTLRTSSRYFRASEAGDCKRKLWYRISGYRPAPNDGWLKHLGIQGDVDHDVVRDMLLHYGAELEGLKFAREEDGSVSVEELEKVRETFDVDGTDVTIACRSDGSIHIRELLDEVFPDHGTDGLALLEVKGMDGFSWRWANKAFAADGMDGVKEYIEEKKPYVWQMNTTMKLVGRPYAYLMVKDRSLSQSGFHNESNGERIGGGVWKFDPNLWKRTLNRMAIVRRAVDSGEPPRPDHAEGSKACKQCAWSYLCHGAEGRRRMGLEPAIVYPVPGEEDFHVEPVQSD